MAVWVSSNMDLIVQKLKMMNRTLLALAVFALLIAVMYGSTLQNGFVYDDAQVVDNPYMQDLKYFSKIVTGCTWEYAHGQCEGRTNYYRPTQSLSYVLTWQISSSPGFFHLVNILQFLAAVFLVFLLAKTLTNDVLFSFMAGFIFLIHPIQSEPVNWISGIPDITFAIFALLATIFYVKHRQRPVVKGSFLTQHKSFLFVIVFYSIALASKEPAVFLLVIFAFLDLIYFRIKIRDLFRVRELAKYSILVGLFLVYLWARVSVIGAITKGGTGYYGNFSYSETIYASITLFGQYIQKLINPYPLTFFYQFEKISDLGSLKFALSFLVVLMFIAASFYFLKKGKNMLAFSFLWFILFLAPVLLFFRALGDSLFSERYLFVPTIGFSFAVAALFVYVWRKTFSNTDLNKAIRPVLLGILALVTLISIGMVWDRNKDWKDNETFFTRTLATNPEAHSLRYNLAVVYRQKGDHESSRKELEIIEKYNPRLDDRPWDGMTLVYYYLGNYYLDIQDDQDQAREYYVKSITAAAKWGRDWKGHFAYNRMGDILVTEDKYVSAALQYCRAVQLYGESESTQQNFEDIIATIAAAYEGKSAQKYDELVDGDAFRKAEGRGPQYVSRVCNEESCSFVFSLQSSQTQAVLPFLIMAATPNGEVAEITGSSYNPNTSEAVFQIDPIYENKELLFVFPTCEGLYYEIQTRENDT